MQKADIRIGKEYVLRERKGPDADIQRIKIISHVRGKKWKAEWIEPNPGLIDYIESQKLVVSWRERKGDIVKSCVWAGAEHIPLVPV